MERLSNLPKVTSYKSWDSPQIGKSTKSHALKDYHICGSHENASCRPPAARSATDQGPQTCALNTSWHSPTGCSQPMTAWRGCYSRSAPRRHRTPPIANFSLRNCLQTTQWSSLLPPILPSCCSSFRLSPSDGFPSSPPHFLLQALSPIKFLHV